MFLFFLFFYFFFFSSRSALLSSRGELRNRAKIIAARRATMFDTPGEVCVFEIHVYFFKNLVFSLYCCCCSLSIFIQVCKRQHNESKTWWNVRSYIDVSRGGTKLDTTPLAVVVALVIAQLIKNTTAHSFVVVRRCEASADVWGVAAASSHDVSAHNARPLRRRRFNHNRL